MLKIYSMHTATRTIIINFEKWMIVQPFTQAKIQDSISMQNGQDEVGQRDRPMLNDPLGLGINGASSSVLPERAHGADDDPVGQEPDLEEAEDAHPGEETQGPTFNDINII